MINKPPESGQCACYGDEYPFIVLLTYHSCECWGWKDPEGAGVRTYQFQGTESE